MNEYIGKTKEELRRTLEEFRGKLQAFRFAMAGSKVKNVKEGKGIRKEIARISTALNQK
jgi:ribosomal protein L29